MVDSFILMPPIAFLVVLAAVMGLYHVLPLLGDDKKRQAEGTTKPYACGEESPSPMIQPDYSQFLPFAVFFTILHVVALTIATVPAGPGTGLMMPVLYLVSAIIGLTILYRR